jgi:mannose-1-phosphate guanylyltransferase
MMPVSEHYYAVIMAGGGGTRLWPLSRKARPKQMLALVDEHTLFQNTIQRIRGLFPVERIFVVTVADQARELQAQCPEIPTQNYLIEPAPRGTASVVGLAAIAIQKIDPQAVMAILASDHYIGQVELFRQLLVAAELAARDGYLVTLGIDPTYPSTGFGYVQMGERVGSYLDRDVFRVEKFREKPDEAQAQAMLAAGGFSWNSGMFFWPVGLILDEIKRQMPMLAAGLTDISQAWGTPAAEDVLTATWSGLRTESIDYGVMEGAENVVVLPAAGLEWNDVGSWDSLFDFLKGDENGNIIIGGDHLGMDTHNSLLYVNQPHRLIVTIGVEDLVLVDTGDVLLVCRKDQAQRVRQVVSALKEKGLEYI